MKQFKFFSTCQNLADLKKEFKKLALINHHDRGGSTEVMQQINDEYKKALLFISKNDFLDIDEEIYFSDEYLRVIKEGSNLEGTIFELVGGWLWLSGNTFAHKTIIKSAGFLFAKNKKSWFYRTEDKKSANKGLYLSMDEIRGLHGSKIISGFNKTLLNN